MFAFARELIDYSALLRTHKKPWPSAFGRPSLFAHSRPRRARVQGQSSADASGLRPAEIGVLSGCRLRIPQHDCDAQRVTMKLDGRNHPDRWGHGPDPGKDRGVSVGSAKYDYLLLRQPRPRRCRAYVVARGD